MTQQDKVKFSELLAGLGEIYDKQITEFTADIYFNVLKDYSFEQVRGAVDAVVRTHKYNTLPKPAEIIEKIEGKKEDSAILAWDSVIKAIRKYDYIETVIFEDKVIHRVIDSLGGWQWLCDQTKDDLRFIAKDFQRLYSIFQNRDGEAPEKLLGFVEQENFKKGYDKDIPEAKRIGGDKEIAKLTGI
jgi:hypothetical protein